MKTPSVVQLVTDVTALLERHEPPVDLAEVGDAPRLTDTARAVYRAVRRSFGATPAAARVVLAEAVLGELADAYPEQCVASPGVVTLCRASKASLFALTARAARMIELLDAQDRASRRVH